MAVNNIVQLIFPEFKKLFSNIYGESALAILKEYPSVKKLAKARVSRLASLIHGRCKYTTEQLIGATRHSIGLYRGGLKLRIGFIALVFQRAMCLIRIRGLSPFAKPVSALRSLPSVALSSDAVKAILLYHIL